MQFEPPILGPDILSDVSRSFSYEWLETNGLGSYAMGTPVFLNTRKYHSLLSIRPEGLDERHSLVSHFDIEIVVGGKAHRISTNQYPAVFHPKGYLNAQRFELDHYPETVFLDRGVETKVGLLMPFGREMTILRFDIRPTSDADATDMQMRLKPFLSYREHHRLANENRNAELGAEQIEGGIRLSPYTGMPPVSILASSPPAFTAEPDWYRCFRYMREEERGYDFEEDLMTPGTLEVNVEAGAPVYIAIIAEENSVKPGVLETLFGDEVARREAERARLEAVLSEKIPGDHGHLTLLGEQSRHFLVSSRRLDSPSIIAGFPWFGEWGRDTMIALEGITLDLGRYDEAFQILETFARYERDGLFPNQLSVTGNSSYNTVDASLWFFHAVERYIEASGDSERPKHELVPAMERILSAYFEDRVPDADIRESGMLRAGSAETQLTWMDASVGGAPVTPRHGYPIEIQALWYNALCVYRNHAGKQFVHMDRLNRTIELLEAHVPGSFWIDEGYLADVVSLDGDVDASIRPNQILAVSLNNVLFTPEQARSVLACVEKHLLTPYGFRTLAPESPNYAPAYRGSQVERDRAYHQGTVWPWLLGPYSDAVIRFHGAGSDEICRLKHSIFSLYVEHLGACGVGSVSEVFDADPPFKPGGCPMQAWSVAGAIHALIRIEERCPE